MSKKTNIKLAIIAIFFISIMIFVIPTKAWGYNFYCNEDSQCHPYAASYGSGDPWKSVAGIYHQMSKNGPAWLTSSPIRANWYRGEDPEGGWNGIGLATVDRVGGVCFGHYYAGTQSGGWCKVETVIDVNENNKNIEEQLLGYAAWASTSSGETGRAPYHKNQIRKWLWDFYPSKYGGNIQSSDNNRREEYRTPEASAYANSVVREAFSTTSKETEGAKQTIEYKNGNTYIGPYNLKMEFGTLTDATVYTRDGKSYSTNLYSTDGNSIGTLSDLSSYNSNSFYIVVRGTSVDSVKKITLSKKLNVISARIVVAETVVRGGQYVSVFYGEKNDKTKSLDLPGVPSSNIKIIKKDENTGKALANVGFIVYNETEKKWVQDAVPAQYVDNKNEATIYKTDDTGMVTIRNLSQKGKYIVYEVINPNFGYVDVSIENPHKTVEITISAVGQSVEQTITNKKTYIKISGYVWEDIISQKASIRNNLWRNDANDMEDQRINNITVTLKGANGNIIDTRITNQIRNSNNQLEDGAYIFGDYERDTSAKKIKIEDLQGAYIEFSYNGMCYKSVAVQTFVDNGNKATDDKYRDNVFNSGIGFNNSYATVTNGQAQTAEGNKTFDLNYSYRNHTSTLEYGGTYLYGYRGQRYPVSGVSQQYTVQANTKDAAPEQLLGQKITIDDIYKQEIDEIKNINLGLRERERADIALVQDIDNAKITLNGYEHTYKYSQRFKVNDKGEYTAGLYEDGFNVSVKFGNKYNTQTYTREIYSSDIVYNKQEGNNGKLGIYLTYKISLRNEATTVYTKVNEITNYFDNRYEINSITDAKGKETNYKIDEQYNKSGYKKVNINVNKNILPEHEDYIYITYKLQNEAVNSILNGDITLASTSEVVSYSSYSDSNFTNKYAGIDKDSEPGTVQPENKDTYEDDTDAAPALILKTPNTRTIKGNVWEENEIEELLEKSGYDKERKGDGKYTTNENSIQNVQVELLKIDVNPDGKTIYPLAKLYQFTRDGKVENIVDASKNTNKKGEYQFDGVIPGNYLLRYTYGDYSVIYNTKGEKVGNISAEKYKSTIYRSGNTTDKDDYWYRTETGTDATRLSDAKDERGIYNKDAEIPDGITLDENNSLDIVNRRTTMEDITYNTATFDNELENIQANTRKFDIKLEYDINLDNISEFGANLKFVFDNIDFGIIRRPIQNLEVKKEISYIEITLANGQVVISGDPRNGNVIEHLKFLPDGKVHIEIDNEIIQGATLKVEYEIIVDNSECEIDYNNRDYYIYGIVPKNHNGWKIATVKDLYDYPNNGLNFNQENQKDPNIWEDINETPGQVLSKLKELKESGRISQETYDTLKNYSRILHTETFTNMKPGDGSKSVTMTLTRLLSNNEESFTFDNDIEVNVSNGRVPDSSTPGNYVPGKGSREPDDDNTEIIITGPTGGNNNYIPYIVLGISCLVILGAGVVFVKKKVIHKQ